MNYYERHLGDYARDTAHLSMLEHGAYTLLLDRYYATEQPIPADQAHRLARARTRDERDAVDAVLAEFFTLDDGCWHHKRADHEVEKAHARIAAAKQNGTKGGRPRKPNVTQEKPSGFPLGLENETQLKALHTPDSNKPPLSPAHDDRLDLPGLSDYHPVNWQPDQTELASLLRTTGRPMPSAEQLADSLVNFNLHFAGKPLANGETHRRFVRWILEDRTREQSRQARSGTAAGRPRGFEAGDANIERWAAEEREREAAGQPVAGFD